MKLSDVVGSNEAIASCSTILEAKALKSRYSVVCFKCSTKIPLNEKFVVAIRETPAGYSTSFYHKGCGI